VSLFTSFKKEKKRQKSNLFHYKWKRLKEGLKGVKTRQTFHPWLSKRDGLILEQGKDKNMVRKVAERLTPTVILSRREESADLIKP